MKKLTLVFTLFVFSFARAQNPVLYGMTWENGVGYGNLFKIVTPGTYTDLIDFTGTSGLYPGWQPGGNLMQASDSMFYGMASGSGTNSNGNIFKYNPSTGIYTNLVDFTGTSGSYIGLNPMGTLIQATDGDLYGMTGKGGTGGLGNIFKYNPVTGIFVNLINFSGNSIPYNGGYPFGNLIQAKDGKLYGMTEEGTDSTFGNIFSYDPALGIYTPLVNFTGTSGSYMGAIPYGSLIQTSDGNLYGMTAEGGTQDSGTIFKYNPTSRVFTNLVSFTGNTGSYIGHYPTADLVQATDGSLYGMTHGLNGDYGTIFKYNPTSSVFTNLVNFTGISGSYIGGEPWGNLIQASDSNLYGMTYNGGTSGVGNIFKYNPVSAVFNDLVDFTGSSGSSIGLNPFGSLLEYKKNTTGIFQPENRMNDISLYPNPCNGNMNIILTGTGYKSIKITDELGEELYSQSIDAGKQNQNLNINLGNVSNGVYIMQIISGDGVISKRIMVQK
jgi:uncharacterized repeat protein (TIGR03803 family)